ncbi:MAG: 3-hydroxyacyl-ACP dehydratase FabZ [Thermoanaerobaculia bacterium]
MLNINEIMRILPHRYPLLLIDRILEIDGDDRIVGLKNVTANEQFFQGHFPGNPVMPGVLIVEAMAQCGAVLFTRDVPDREKKLFFFGGIDKARFRRPVIPGDQVVIEVTVMQRRASSARFKGVAKVEGQVVAEAELMTVMVERPE